MSEESFDDAPRRLWFYIEGSREKEVILGLTRVGAIAVFRVVPAWHVVTAAASLREAFFVGHAELAQRVLAQFWSEFSQRRPELLSEFGFNPLAGDWIVFLPSDFGSQRQTRTDSRDRGLLVVKILGCAPYDKARRESPFA